MEVSMKRMSRILALGAPLAFIFCAAGLIHVLIEKEQGTGAVLHPVDAIILFLALCGLIIAFLLAHMLSGSTFYGLTIHGRLRSVLTLAVLLLLPQCAILYTGIARTVHSDVTLFAVSNMMDLAVGRLLFALLRRRPPLLPGPREDTREDRG
jgi:hypothetical protein